MDECTYFMSINYSQVNYNLLMRSPTKKSSPSKRQPSNSPVKHISPAKTHNDKLVCNDYFCHYANAVYMGGINCFKRQNQGIMLLDNGACAITCYIHDVMVDHNIIFRDGSLTSILVSDNRSKSVCYRRGHLLNYFKMNSRGEFQDSGYFVDYYYRKVFKVKYSTHGDRILVKQRITDLEFCRKIIQQEDLSVFLEQKHIKAIKMNFQLPKYMKRTSANERHLIGFVKPNRNGAVYSGLYFKINVKQSLLDYDVFLQQRGYVEKQIMQKFGERHFQNKNYYLGEFQKGRYHGRGILMYPLQRKWVLGDFIQGQLKNVIQTSVNNEGSSCQAAIKKIHEYCKPYIDFKIQFTPTEKQLLSILETIDKMDPYQSHSLDYVRQENKLQDNLYIVQKDYTEGRYELRTQEALKNILEENDKKKRRSLERLSNKSQRDQRSQQKTNDQRKKNIYNSRSRSKSGENSNSHKRKSSNSPSKKRNFTKPIQNSHQKIENFSPKNQNNSPINDLRSQKQTSIRETLTPKRLHPNDYSVRLNERYLNETATGFIQPHLNDRLFDEAAINLASPQLQNLTSQKSFTSHTHTNKIDLLPRTYTMSPHSRQKEERQKYFQHRINNSPSKYDLQYRNYRRLPQKQRSRMHFRYLLDDDDDIFLYQSQKERERRLNNLLYRYGDYRY